MTWTGHGRDRYEYRAQKNECAEHIWRINAAFYGRTMSKKEQWERYGNYVEPAPHPESPRAIALWNAGEMPVFCPEVQCDISRYVNNGKCNSCTSPCINHSRNTAKRQQVLGWENYVLK